MFAAIFIAAATLEIAGTLAGEWTWAAQRPGAGSPPVTHLVDRRRLCGDRRLCRALGEAELFAGAGAYAAPRRPQPRPNRRAGARAALRTTVGYGHGRCPGAENDYLEGVLNASVYDVAIEIAARARRRSLSRAARQPPAAQARGPAAGILVQAARRVQQDGAASRRRGSQRGVIAAAAGNHAQGVALAAQRLGCRRRS